MKRYGDNVTQGDVPEELSESERAERNRVFYGGCGAMFGSIPGPEKTPQATRAKKNTIKKLLTFLDTQNNAQANS